jgi:hypothetical protein
MALPHKDVCKKIYEKHSKVLDEIFMSVKGVAPGSRSSRRAFGITLTQLANNNIISDTDILYKKIKGQMFQAKLIKKDGEILILYDGKEFTNPSPAGWAVGGNNQPNGWTFWTVQDSNGDDKGTLAELRKELEELKGKGPPPNEKGV